MDKLIIIYVCVLPLIIVFPIPVKASHWDYFSPDDTAGCDELGFSFSSNGRNWDDVVIITAGYDAKINLNYNWSSDNSFEYRRGRRETGLKATWSIPLENYTNEVRLFDMLRGRREEWRFRRRTFDTEHNITVTDPEHRISAYYPSGQINITFTNFGLGYNNSEIIVEDLYGRQKCARTKIVITYCKAEGIPSALTLTTSTSNVQNFTRKLIAQCRTGSLFSTGSKTSYLPYVDMECDVNNEWKYLNNVKCFPIESFELNSKIATLEADKPFIVFCKSNNNSLIEELRIGNQSVSKYKGLAWKNITFGPEDNNMVASCIETDRNKVTVNESTTQLDIQFPPIVTSRDLHFKVRRGSACHISIVFEANPSVSFISAVRVIKNGINMTNVYMKVHGVSHTVVVHFTKVRESDFGDYVMVVTSRLPRSTVLNVTFDITESITQQQQPTATSSIGNILSIVLGSALFLCIICLVIFAIKKRQNKPKVTETPTPPGHIVTYNATACERYETVDDTNSGNPRARSTAMNVVYANVEPVSHYANVG